MTGYADDGLAGRALRLVRRTLDAVEAALRPPDAISSPDHDADDEPDDEPDATTTRDILVPRHTGERASNRATRQAQDYLARRRWKLRADLDDR